LTVFRGHRYTPIQVNDAASAAGSMETTGKRYMGLDVGERRIGIAFSDEEGLVATPRDTLRRQSLEKDLATLGRLARSEGAAGIVVGLPISMDGSEGREAQKVREFISALGRESGLPVTPWDERLSTVAAERALVAQDVSRARRREVVDRVAAALILQSYLDFRRSQEASPSNPT
jgi:putative Holliday junction resolvase